MVYSTLFHLHSTNLISFDQYLAIADNAHLWIVNDGYDFVLTARLQSDPIERRFS